MDREFGQAELKKYGINTLPHWEFDNYDQAIAFIKKNPGRYVFKPSGNVPAAGKGLLFLGQEEDGQDILALLEKNKDVWQKKAPTFQLQQFVKGVEIAVGAYFNGTDFIRPINVNIEHKKLFPGDLGPMTGEMGCYDEKTEVLTENGWKYFKNLTYKDKIASLDPKTNKLEYSRPSNIVVYTHHKKMIQIKNQTIDILVTPGHNMWVQKRRRKKWEFIRADAILTNPPKIARTAEWQGKEIKSYTVPGYIEKHRVSNSHKVPIKYPPVTMPMDIWLKFLGIFLAEGSLGGGNEKKKTSITIAQRSKKDEVRELLKHFPFKTIEFKDGFQINSVQLAKRLEKYNFGKCNTKYVPKYVKFLSPRQIKIFLDAYTLGDGTIMKGGWRILYTSSKRMANDTQELLLKINRVGIIKKRNRFEKKIWIEDHWTKQKHDAFEIIERIKKKYSYLDGRDTKIVNYRGKVYCATVSSHIMYVRRNGKPYWCGNTLSFWSETNPIFEATLEKMRQPLAQSGYHGYIDLNCIVNGQGIYPLEFTSRFGYPILQIHLEGIITPAGQWILKMARGENIKLRTKKGFQIGARVMVPTYFVSGDDPEMKVYRDLPILFKKADANLNGIHIEDVKQIKGQWRIAGTSGCLLVVTGSGTTVAAARHQVYQRIKNILIQNMFYRMDIGTKWAQDSDRLQTWGYLY